MPTKTKYNSPNEFDLSNINLGTVGQVLGTGAGALIGGPAGAAIGGQLGSGIGNLVNQGLNKPDEKTMSYVDPNVTPLQARSKQMGAYQMSYAPTKMSAYQAKQANKMMNVSGAFTLTDGQKEIAEKSGNPNKIEGSDFAVLREEKKDKAPMTMNYQKAAPMMDGQSIYTYYKK